MKKRKESDALDELIPYAIVLFFIAAVSIAVAMWHNLGPENFFIVWLLCAVCTFCGTLNSSSLEDIDRTAKSVLITLDLVVSLLLGPTVILAAAMVFIGWSIRRTTKKIDQRSVGA